MWAHFPEQRLVIEPRKMLASIFFRLFHAFWKYLMARKVGTWGYILVKGFFGVLFKVLAIFLGGCGV